ncbi:MAG: agmatinase family protein [Flavobacteriales bacterium]|nr:agmatinase family protein [Flavobacteriales bacterium]
MTSKEKKIKAFDPNSYAATESNIFGLPFDESEAEVVLIPVPWEVTVSYGAGTAEGPEAILEASKQVDLYYPENPDGWKEGFYMAESPKKLRKISEKLRKKTEAYLDLLFDGKTGAESQKLLRAVNEGCTEMVEWVKNETASRLKEGKKVGLVGGDHSTPLGYMQALEARHGSFSVLQIDAHADLRDAFEGFEYSHASIMFNALKLKGVEKLVQVGIRDYCQAEAELIKNSKGRVQTLFYAEIGRGKAEGKSFADMIKSYVNTLGQKVYISFDIDGLDPRYCPNTGTPVPGGLEFDEAVYLMKSVVDSGREIIGFDLNEVAPGDDEWDANVGARMLFHMVNLMLISGKKSRKTSTKVKK